MNSSPATTFSELDLLPEILKAIDATGYTTPTPIQAQTIPLVLEGQDVMGCAQTGTGKTAAFSLPVLNHLGKQNRRSVPRSPRVLILSPTRELAAQIGESLDTYAKYLRIRSTVIFGGVGQGRQVRALQKGVHIVVATPGRLLDLMGQGHIRLDDLEVFILDEADRMFDMGFMPDLKKIIAKLPEERQSLFFTATLPPRVAELAEGLLQNPVRVDVAPQSTPVERIAQQVLFVSQSEKPAVLDNLLRLPEVDKVLIFTRTKRGADKVTKQLENSGVRAEAIHGNKSQNARTQTLDRFRSNRLQVLVATDLAARGIDVDGVTHVINFDLPYEPECYVHRIGRTARAGQSGTALSFCDPTERKLLRAIEKLIRQSLPVHEDHPDTNPGGYHGGSQGGRGGQRRSRYGSGNGGGNGNGYRSRRPSNGRGERSGPPRSAEGNRESAGAPRSAEGSNSEHKPRQFEGRRRAPQTGNQEGGYGQRREGQAGGRPAGGRPAGGRPSGGRPANKAGGRARRAGKPSGAYRHEKAPARSE